MPTLTLMSLSYQGRYYGAASVKLPRKISRIPQDTKILSRKLYKSYKGRYNGAASDVTLWKI